CRRSARVGRRRPAHLLPAHSSQHRSAGPGAGGYRHGRRDSGRGDALVSRPQLSRRRTARRTRPAHTPGAWTVKIGIVSDTHGLLRPEVAPILKGVERILHLGDVGKPSILEELGKIAPVTAIRGNVDREGSCGKLPETDVVLIEGHYL